MNPWTEPPQRPAWEVAAELLIAVALMVAVLLLLVP
jgi:hypothetical protein